MITEHVFEKLIWRKRPGFQSLYVYNGAEEYKFSVMKNSREEKDGKIIFKLAEDNFVILDKGYEQTGLG